jgi:hypothetical protein
MQFKYLWVVVTAALALAGCSNNDDQTGANTSAVPAQSSNAAAAAVSPVARQKDEFLAAMDQKMKDLDAGIDDLSKKAEGYTGDARAAAHKALADLREQRAALGKKYDDPKQSSEAAWEDTKAGFQSAWDDFEKSYENVKSKFS